MNIGILCPTRERVEKCKLMIESALDNAAQPNNVHIVLRLDSSDFENHEGYKKLIRPGIDRVLIGPSICLSTLWNQCYNEIENFTDINLQGNDDIKFESQDWDNKIKEGAELHPKGIGIQYANDLNQNGQLATFSFITKKWTEILGSFVVEGYAHDYCDTTATYIGMNLRQLGYPNCFIYREDVILNHLHHSFGKSEFDSVYRLAQQRKARQDCGILYQQREPERKECIKKLLEVLGN